MLQIIKTPKPEITYAVNPAFMSTRKAALSVHTVTLSEELLGLGKRNLERIQQGRKGSTYHVHVKNVHNIYVTIIITCDNRLTLRGKMYTKLDQLFLAIDTYKN